MMDDKKKMVPRIRFRGFGDAWEQRKLGKLVREFDKKVLGSSNLPIATSSRSGLWLQKDYFDRSDEKNQNTVIFHMLPKGFITYRHMSDDAKFHFNQNNFFTDVLVSKEYPVFSAIIPKDQKFILYYLNNSSSFAKFALEQKKGGTRTRLYFKNLKLFSLKVPEKNQERQNIGDLFFKLDNLIVASEKKIRQLKKLKTLLLQKLFDQNWRFEGFKDPWEQRKLLDLTKIYSGLTYAPKDVQKTGTFVIRSSNIQNNKIVSKDDVFVQPSIVSSENVQLNDVIVVVRNGSRSLIGKHALVTQSMPQTVIGAFMSGLRGEGKFVKSLLDTSKFSLELHRSLGATINQITKKDFSLMTFFVPVQESEREHIANLIVLFDNLIVANERYLYPSQQNNSR